MNKPEITKEKFEEYRRWQRLGFYNMLDYNSWRTHTTLTEDEWFEIVNNYSQYKEQFES